MSKRRARRHRECLERIDRLEQELGLSPIPPEQRYVAGDISASRSVALLARQRSALLAERASDTPTTVAALLRELSGPMQTALQHAIEIQPGAAVPVFHGHGLGGPQAPAYVVEIQPDSRNILDVQARATGGPQLIVERGSLR